ncbi:hypothetical protein E2542_SST22930 [Spatholobus suberectus]|nr:hypothetical protein E2542_SST22930 [Spatholobus suberectus]
MEQHHPHSLVTRRAAITFLRHLRHTTIVFPRPFAAPPFRLLALLRDSVSLSLISSTIMIYVGRDAIIESAPVNVAYAVTPLIAAIT